MVSLEIVTSYAEFLRMKPLWDELLQQSGNHTVFLTWEWMKAWWDVLRTEESLHIVIGRNRQNEVIGIAPFMRKTKRLCGIPVSYIMFISSGNGVLPEYLNIITREDKKTEFLNALMQHFFNEKKQWDVLRMTDMRSDNGILGTLKDFSCSRCSYTAREKGQCIYTELPKTWDEYLKSLSRKSRYNITKKIKEMSKEYKLEFMVLDNKAGMSEVMRKLHELHVKRMGDKGMKGTSLTRQFWDFQASVADEFLKNKWLILGLLKANGNIVACQYAYAYDNILFHYQSGIDPTFGKYSVGLISNAYMIQEAIRRGLSEYDFLRGQENYKTHWAKRSRACAEIIVWNNNERARLDRFLYCLHSYKAKLARWIGKD